jgi:hypothetical protein
MRLAQCDGCNRKGVWVNLRTQGVAGEYCAECFDRLGWHPWRNPARLRGVPGPRDEVDPGWDNVIREWESDW